MNLPLFIAGRYLFARKSHNVINIISAISAIGMAIGTAALILILSVYNGFDKIIRDNLSDLDPDLRITPSGGKCFVPEGDAFVWLYNDGRVKSLSSVIEENVFLRYDEKQGVALAKGVDEVYEEESGLSGHVLAGEFKLRNGDVSMAAAGSTLASQMRINPRFTSPLELYFPDRNGKISLTNPSASLSSVKVFPSCIVGISNDIDAELLVVPIGCMRNLLGYDKEVSAVEIRLAGLSGRESRRFAKELEEKLGTEFRVSDRLAQHPALFKMMKYEKAAIFLILIFVVIIVAFNIFGSLSMLMIEKRDDAGILRAMGAKDGMIRKIFILSGWMVSLLGLAAGLIAGCVLALIQQFSGIIRMPGNFLVESYPVVLQASDVLITAAAVAAIGLAVAVIPTINQNKKI